MAAVFLLAAESLPDDSAIDEVPEWDSLRHLELMLALEMEFGVRISTSRLLKNSEVYSGLKAGRR